MFEHHRKPLISRKEFISRQLQYTGFSLLVLIFSIGIGTVGYHFWGELPWIDSFLNASMISNGSTDFVTKMSGQVIGKDYVI